MHVSHRDRDSRVAGMNCSGVSVSARQAGAEAVVEMMFG
jgi:hypothetical protein